MYGRVKYYGGKNNNGKGWWVPFVGMLGILLFLGGGLSTVLGIVYIFIAIKGLIKYY